MRPPTARRPDVGLTIPESRRSSVVLPDPFRPTRPTALPGSTPNETSRNAQTSEPRACRRANRRSFSARLSRGIHAEAARDVLDEDLPCLHAGDRTARCAPDDPGKRPHESRIVVRHLDPLEPQPELLRELDCLDVEIPADLEMVRDEPDGADEHRLDALLVQRAQVIEDVGAEPRLAGRRLALERERPVLGAGGLGDEPRRLEQLLLVRIAELEDSGGQRVRREHDVRVGAANLRREELDEAGLVVPAVDEAQLGASVERALELLAIALNRERRVVRREDEADDRFGAARERRFRSVADARRPVLHAGEHRQLELPLERGARLLGDRVQRRRVLDPEPAVALDEIVEVLGRDRPPAADVRVVRGHVGEPLGRAVRHQARPRR